MERRVSDTSGANNLFVQNYHQGTTAAGSYRTRNGLTLGLGIGLGVGVPVLVALVWFMVQRRSRVRQLSQNLRPAMSESSKAPKITSALEP